MIKNKLSNITLFYLIADFLTHIRYLTDEGQITHAGKRSLDLFVGPCVLAVVIALNVNTMF